MALALCATPALAEDVTLVGVFGDKAAILSTDGGEPRTVRVGQKLGGVTLISVEGDRATVEIDGKRRVLVRGQSYSSRAAASGAQSVTLAADSRGHFFADGTINGNAIRFVVDTGATTIALSSAEAERMRLDYRKGQQGTAQTAAGPVSSFLIKLDSVRVGGIELQNVDAVVIERGLPIALLGMTFLNRVEMQRNGDRMTLIRRY